MFSPCFFAEYRRDQLASLPAPVLTNSKKISCRLHCSLDTSSKADFQASFFQSSVAHASTCWRFMWFSGHLKRTNFNWPIFLTSRRLMNSEAIYGKGGFLKLKHGTIERMMTISIYLPENMKRLNMQTRPTVKTGSPSEKESKMQFIHFIRGPRQKSIPDKWWQLPKSTCLTISPTPLWS